MRTLLKSNPTSIFIVVSKIFIEVEDPTFWRLTMARRENGNFGITVRCTYFFFYYFFIFLTIS